MHQIHQFTNSPIRLYDPGFATPMTLIGLHHVTATVDDAQDDLDFCLAGLGLRLVKKTVNFDNHHVYHFYYGDERGTPGTIWTTFPYKAPRAPARSPSRRFPCRTVRSTSGARASAGRASP
jgi:catechol 2,3-dioxygenase-like lactoylglutathione lyase family enzyme